MEFVNSAGKLNHMKLMAIVLLVAPVGSVLLGTIKDEQSIILLLKSVR